jgi:hypothetical protein
MQVKLAAEIVDASRRPLFSVRRVDRRRAILQSHSCAIADARVKTGENTGAGRSIRRVQSSASRDAAYRRIADVWSGTIVLLAYSSVVGAKRAACAAFILPA